MKRKLAAILAADVVGYSRLMGEDETGTLARLKAHREELIDPEIARHHGRIVKLMGDGALVEFASVVDAVECAVVIQKAMAVRNAEVPEGLRIEFRIGINLGDVIIEDEDIYGDGVNIAARLEGLADGGGVVVSGSVHDLIQGKLALAFEDGSTHEVKNIARPIQIWRWLPVPSVSEEKRAAETNRLTPDKPSIAVLPFENLSGDPDQEYFADGLTEDIITALSYTRSIPVIARNSSFSYKGQSVNIQEAAKALNAKYLLEGSVRKAGNRFRVTVQLIDGESGHHVWANKYDRPLDDVFDIQDEITLRVVIALQPELAEAEFRKQKTKRTESLTAWDHFLRGMSYLQKDSCEDNAQARAYFQNAADIDPSYGEAWAGLGWSHLRDFDFKCTGDLQASLDMGLEAALKGVKLDDASAFTHYVLSTAYVWREELSLSLIELKQTLELNPYFARAHLALGNRMDLAGQSEEGIAGMKRALELNPRDPERHLYMSYLSRALAVQGEFDEAFIWAENAVGLRSDNPDMQYRLAVCLAHLDRVEDARAALDSCERLRPGFVTQRESWHPYNDDERNRRFFAGMKRHGLRP
ncbi:MAG: tetratricopeptide repeat protein [Alphaproteobacteria bacterium]